MRHSKILSILEHNKIVPIVQFMKESNVSERSVREILKELKLDGFNHGFLIKTIRQRGYLLEIIDIEEFDNYKKQLNDYGDIAGKEIRISTLLYFLLQNDDYISIEELSDLVEVSRNTILRDLPLLRKQIEELNLELESKKKYGILVRGDESSLRKAISKYVIHSYKYTSSTQGYFEFLDGVDLNKLNSFFLSIFEKYDVLVSEEAKYSIIDHCKVLLFRISIDNYLSGEMILLDNVTENQLKLAVEIAKGLEEGYNITIPKREIDYLATQISGKTTTEQISLKYRNELVLTIKKILTQLDHEYMTNFSNDKLLLEALLMHIYPLLNRAIHKIEFQNPLIEQVYSEYANVFLIAMRFADLWTPSLQLSSDEIGYLALHFASNLERQKSDILNNYRRILIVSRLGRSNILYLKEKIQNGFKNAIVELIINIPNTESINEMGADLILSTTKLEDKLIKVPIIYIKEMLDDNSIMEIKEQLLLNTEDHEIHRVNISDLMNECFFEIATETDYLKLLSGMSIKMEDKGVAIYGFEKSVIERELSFTTIYENGVAGPHSMKLNAIKETIGVIIPKRKTVYEGKEVKIIFLINLKKGSLFLYKKISDYNLSVIGDSSLLKQLIEVDNFKQFIEIIRETEGNG